MSLEYAAFAIPFALTFDISALLSFFLVLAAFSINLSFLSSSQSMFLLNWEFTGMTNEAASPSS